jgi:hypothetical protein
MQRAWRWPMQMRYRGDVDTLFLPNVPFHMRELFERAQFMDVDPQPWVPSRFGEKASRAVANLATSGRGCLLMAVPAGVFEIRVGQTRELDLAGDPALRGFALTPLSVHDKSASYATIVTPWTFRLHDRNEALARWDRVRRAGHDLARTAQRRVAAVAPAQCADHRTYGG